MNENYNIFHQRKTTCTFIYIQKVGRWTDEKVTCPQKYLDKGLKSPSPGSEKIPCNYSARGAKIQPRFGHSADQGKITKQVLPQRKCAITQKVKARDNEFENKQAHHSGGQEGLLRRSGGGYQKNITGKRRIRRRG